MDVKSSSTQKLGDFIAKGEEEYLPINVVLCVLISTLFGVFLSDSNRHTFLHSIAIAIIVSTTSMVSLMKLLFTIFSIILLLGIFNIQDVAFSLQQIRNDGTLR